MANIALVLENIRSAYNVWNIIRSADAFGIDIIISWYTPSPFSEEKVRKTSLWAEKTVNIYEYRDTTKAIEFARSNYFNIIAAEITSNSIWLEKFWELYDGINQVAIILWNEIEGVLPDSLSKVDDIFHIQMDWSKESLNVWQTWAIFMREISRCLKNTK